MDEEVIIELESKDMFDEYEDVSEAPTPLVVTAPRSPKWEWYKPEFVPVNFRTSRESVTLREVNTGLMISVSILNNDPRRLSDIANVIASAVNRATHG
jgi:hypothetical protein